MKSTKKVERATYSLGELLKPVAEKRGLRDYVKARIAVKKPGGGRATR